MDGVFHASSLIPTMFAVFHHTGGVTFSLIYFSDIQWLFCQNLTDIDIEWLIGTSIHGPESSGIQEATV